MPSTAPYRGRLAPTPSGRLHRGHARTFAVAWERARRAGGALVMRIEDLDRARCRAEWEADALADLRWLGLDWDEGPDVGGPQAPYRQSERGPVFLDAFRALAAQGLVYPSPHSRADVERALGAPHEGEEAGERPFPTALRAPAGAGLGADHPGAETWRFRVPDGRTIRFDDALAGPQSFVAGEDFGDFVVWRRDGVPAYELAVVADDRAMRITEVVRGADLLLSTARQILLHEALGGPVPAWAHVPLVRDAAGRRLAKRDAASSIAALRAAGVAPEAIRAGGA